MEEIEGIFGDIESLKSSKDFAAAIHFETDTVICKRCWRKANDFVKDDIWMKWTKEDAKEMFEYGHYCDCNHCGWIVGSKRRVDYLKVVK